MATATLFGRQDHDVIDWLRPTTAERWRTYNIRDVDTVGAEFSRQTDPDDGSFVQAGYTALDVNAAAVTQLSKYVLDYAPHSVAVAASVVLPSSIRSRRASRSSRGHDQRERAVTVCSTSV